MYRLNDPSKNLEEMLKYYQDHPGVSFQDVVRNFESNNPTSNMTSANKAFKDNSMDSDSIDIDYLKDNFKPKDNDNINPEIDTPVEINQGLLDYYDSVLDRQDARVQAQNAFNSAEAQKNRDFQAHMSNTAYQRAVVDMKAAGINPMMAYSQGGSSTPSGASATSTYTALGAPSPVTSLDVGNLSVAQISNVLKEANLTEAKKQFFINKLFDLFSSAKRATSNLVGMLMTSS